MAKPIFKTYQQNQVYLFPPSLEEMIDINHPVRVVSEVIDHIDMDIIIKKYKGGGTTSYHPRMLLKVLIYSYFNNVYSSRRIEASVSPFIFIVSTRLTAFIKFNASVGCTPNLLCSNGVFT